MSYNDVIKMPLSALETVKIIKVKSCGNCPYTEMRWVVDMFFNNYKSIIICKLDSHTIEDMNLISEKCKLEDNNE